jgi:hypothetical protein
MISAAKANFINFEKYAILVPPKNENETSPDLRRPSAELPKSLGYFSGLIQKGVRKNEGE